MFGLVGRRSGRLRGVRLRPVVILVVLVLDPPEFEEVDGQQDDAQAQHEPDDQRHGEPSESHFVGRSGTLD